MVETPSWFQRKHDSLLRRHDRHVRHIAAAMVEAGLGDATQQLEPARRRLAAFLDELADPGTPEYRMFTFAGVQQVAIYLTLREHGHSAESIWRWCSTGLERELAAVPGIARWLMSKLMFSGFVRRRYEKFAQASQSTPQGGWVLRYEADADHSANYRVTYDRCAIHAFAVAHDAAEFAPYICLSDIPASQSFGWGLRRTSTIAQGGSRCDFHMRKNQATDVDVPERWLVRPR